MLTQSTPNQTTETMTSYEFWKQINIFRKEEGERKIRHDQFLERVLDECPEGVCKIFAHPQNGQEYRTVDLNEEQMMLVGMRESKAVRKKVLAWVRKMNNPQPMTTAEMFLQTAQFMVDTEKQLKQQQEQLEQLATLPERTENIEQTVGAQTEQLEAIQHRLDTRSTKVGYIVWTDARRKYCPTLSEAIVQQLIVAYEIPNEYQFIVVNGFESQVKIVSEEHFSTAVLDFLAGKVQVKGTMFYTHPRTGSKRFKA